MVTRHELDRSRKSPPQISYEHKQPSYFQYRFVFYFLLFVV
jgi:hypothetical protein